MQVPSFRKGERSSAGKLNMLSEAISRLAKAMGQIRGGRGVRVDNVGGSLVISTLDAEKEDIRQGVVEKVTPSDSSGAPTADYPDNVKYRIRCPGYVGSGPANERDGLLEHEDFVAVVNRPAYGTGTAKIVGQKVGSSVWVWNRRTDQGERELVLVVLEETPLMKVCGT